MPIVRSLPIAALAFLLAPAALLAQDVPTIIAGHMKSRAGNVGYSNATDYTVRFTSRFSENSQAEGLVVWRKPDGYHYENHLGSAGVVKGQREQIFWSMTQDGKESKGTDTAAEESLLHLVTVVGDFSVFEQQGIEPAALTEKSENGKRLVGFSVKRKKNYFEFWFDASNWAVVSVLERRSGAGRPIETVWTPGPFTYKVKEITIIRDWIGTQEGREVCRLQANDVQVSTKPDEKIFDKPEQKNK